MRRKHDARPFQLAPGVIRHAPGLGSFERALLI